MPHESLNSVLYTTAASAEGGRGKCRVRSEDGVLDLELGKPGSVSNPKANPETLFAAGWASCFNNALGRIATSQGFDGAAIVTVASVSLAPTGTRDAPGVGIAAELHLDDPGGRRRHRAGAGGGGPRGLSLLQGHPREHRREGRRRPGLTPTSQVPPTAPRRRGGRSRAMRRGR